MEAESTSQTFEYCRVETRDLCDSVSRLSVSRLERDLVQESLKLICDLFRFSPPLHPPFPYVSAGHVPSPSTSTSLPDRFLDRIGYPLAPSPTSFANPAPSPNLISPEDNYAFLDSFVSEQISRAPPHPQPSPTFSNGSSPIKPDLLPPLPQPTPSSHGRIYHSASSMVLDSSPDPLMMGLPASSPFHRSLPPLPRYVPQAASNPFTSTSHHRSSTNGSSASPFALPNGSPQRPDQTMSPYPARLGGAFEQDAGVESAVKRIKLGVTASAGTPILASGGSGRGKVIGGDTKSESNLLSQLLKRKSCGSLIQHSAPS
jgi:hypothetical protein